MVDLVLLAGGVGVGEGTEEAIQRAHIPGWVKGPCRPTRLDHFGFESLTFSVTTALTASFLSKAAVDNT